MKISNLTLPERVALVTALRFRYQNGLLATNETLQFFTDEQVLIAIEDYPGTRPELMSVLCKLQKELEDGPKAG